METIKVALVDVHDIFRDGLKMLINKEKDLECVAVSNNSEDAVLLARDMCPDVLIIDVDMPGKSGIDIIKHIKDMSASCKILVVSHIVDSNMISNMVEHGVNGYLSKACQTQHVINTIRMVHSGLRVFTPQVTAILPQKHSEESADQVTKRTSLPTREMEIIKLACRGLSNKQIALQLGISEHTVGSHLTSIFRKMNVYSRTEAVLHALQKGWVTLDEPNPEH